MFFADAQPMAAGVAIRINALHGPAGQILHFAPPISRPGGRDAAQPEIWWRILFLSARGVKRNVYN